MKLRKAGLLLLCAAAGCADGAVSSHKASSAGQEDSYDAYGNAVDAMPARDSYTAAVRSSYTMSYSDESTALYQMDGVIEVEDEQENPTAHTVQHIASNGLNSDLEGYYYDGRLYNTYNNVSYYEDMNISELKSTMMMPLAPLQYAQDDVSSVTAEKDDGGNTVYVIRLKEDAAAEIFSSRYDQYGFSSYDDYTVTSNEIRDSFDGDGRFLKETASFTVSITYESQAVSIQYEGSVEYSSGNTTVEISAEQKEKDAGFIAYNEIDPSSISNEVIDDSAEDTAAGTFRKRLIGRLGYEEMSDGTLRDDFNDNMTYIVDFGSCTFEYVNYSIAYVYNWKTDTGAMDACTYDFHNGNASSQCQDSTVETIQEVKNDLQMELYYCGLSLEDLQSEAAG